MNIEPETLHQRWMHSHEEDTDGEMVFRPADYDFPPSRGRQGFDLKPDGTFAETAIGPTDRPEETGGRWELKDGDTLVLSREADDEPKRELRIASASKGRLVVRK